MNFDRQIEAISRGIYAIIRVLTWISAAALGIMVLIVVVNVLGRFLFNHPLLGTVEMVGLLNVVVIFFVLAYTEFKRGHIVVELVSARFSRRAQILLAGTMCFIGAAFFIVVGWQSIKLMLSHLFPLVLSTRILYIPLSPFIFIVALGSVMLGLQMLLHVFHPLTSEEGEKGKV